MKTYNIEIDNGWTASTATALLNKKIEELLSQLDTICERINWDDELGVGDWMEDVLMQLRKELSKSGLTCC